MTESPRDPGLEPPPRQRTESSGGRPRFPTGRPANWLFRIAAAFAALFVLTVVLLSAAAFSEIRAPGIALVERHAGILIAVGVGGTLLFGIAAMTVDRLATLRSPSMRDGIENRLRDGAPKNGDPTDGPGDAPAA